MPETILRSKKKGEEAFKGWRGRRGVGGRGEEGGREGRRREDEKEVDTFCMAKLL